MGREIRRVPPHWEHPRYTADNAKSQRAIGGYIPMYDRPFENDFADWLDDFDRVRRGELSAFERECYPLGLADWLQDDGRPRDPMCYRPKWEDGAATWFQVYETVSEGTPVTPPFATKAELVDYLAANGDFWDQKRRKDGDSIMQCGPWGRAAAERFVQSEWAPSLMVTSTSAGVSIKEARDG